MLGAYTFWDAIWTMIVFFAWIMFITWVILLMIDNFRRKDHSGWAKALWTLFIIFLPIIGAFTYTIARPNTAGDYYDTGHAASGPSSVMGMSWMQPDESRASRGLSLHRRSQSRERRMLGRRGRRKREMDWLIRFASTSRVLP